MKSSVTYAYPDKNFWDAYSELWENSLEQPVFQTPRFINYLAKKFEKSLAVYQFYRDEKLIGAAFFRKHNGVYKLLSEIKADYNFFVIHKDCSPEETKSFFSSFLDIVKSKRWTLVLSYQPSWAPYMEIFKEVGGRHEVYLNVSKHSVCPKLYTDTPEEMMEQFTKSKEPRTAKNRLIKRQGAIFEIYTDDEDIDNWADQFCRCHVKRWETTTTPSRYDTEEMRELNRKCMRAWATDGALIRFSIRVGEERIAFNAVLLQEDTLIGHAQAFDPAFYKFSPGKALMYTIGEWMLSQGLTKLDFGKGGEAYKSDMTNLEPELHKIFISSYANLPFVLKSKLESTVRSYSGLIKIYRQKIKPRIQGARIKIGAKTQNLSSLVKKPKPQGYGTMAFFADFDALSEILSLSTNLL